MDTSKTQSKLYSFYKAVVTVPAFGACFYLLIVCFAATFRLISDIGSVRVLFLNPLLILLVGMAAVFAAGVYFVLLILLKGMTESELRAMPKGHVLVKVAKKCRLMK